MVVPVNEQEFDSSANPAADLVESNNDLNDDIWDSDSGEGPIQGETNPVGDIPRLRREHHTAGYREAIAIAKDQYLQPGFDSGYPLGATVGLEVGAILGTLQGLGLHSLERVAQNELSAEALFSNKFYDETDELARPKFTGSHPEVERWKQKLAEIIKDSQA
ncbi:hypothetical protein DV454_000521 [Geotrichum candidum]|nr:hypothetical protein DV454_000521 [Geotrichum candidum]